jgi:hypothetical protein
VCLDSTRSLPFSLVVFWGGLPSFAAAQERVGFWAGFDVGFGSAGISADDAAGTLSGEGRDNGGVADLSLGWTVNPRVLIGFEVNDWVKASRGALTVSIVNASGTIQFYPMPSSGLFVKGGAGVSTVVFDIATPTTLISTNVGTGVGVMAGTGYDVRLGRGFWLVPAIRFRYGRPDDIELDGQTQFRNWNQNIVDVSVGVAFHRTR